MRTSGNFYRSYRKPLLISLAIHVSGILVLWLSLGMRPYSNLVSENHATFSLSIVEIGSGEAGSQNPNKVEYPAPAISQPFPGHQSLRLAHSSPAELHDQVKILRDHTKTSDFVEVKEELPEEILPVEEAIPPVNNSSVTASRESSTPSTITDILQSSSSSSEEIHQELPVSINSQIGSQNGSSSPPILINERKPPYPKLAIRKKWEGTVTLELIINESGVCGRSTIKQGSGYELLDQTAHQWMRNQKFKPAYKGSTPVSAVMLREVQFQLK